MKKEKRFYTAKDGSIRVYEYSNTKKRYYKPVKELVIPDGWISIDDENNIIYAKVPGYKAIASNDGRIWVWQKQKSSVKEIKYLESNKYGYLKASVLNEKTHKSYSTTVHRVIAYTFGKLSELEYDGNDVDHIDGNPKNNCIENLQVLSHMNNCKKRDINGNVNCKPINLYDKYNGEWKMSFSSAREAAKYFHILYGTNFEGACVCICNTLKGKYPSYRGYKFKYAKKEGK